MLFDVLRLSARRVATLSLVAATAIVPLASSSPAEAAWWGGDACGSTLAKPGGGNWSCSFVDDFSGRSLDSSKWVTGDTSRTGFHAGSTCFLPNQGYSTSRGALRLTVTQTAPFACKTPGGSVTTTSVGGQLSTYGKYSQAYGRFEARIKYPSYRGAGLHGGFWLNPYKNTYGAWPASGEIDVAEWFSAAPDNVFSSIHYSGSTGADTAWNCTVQDVDTFHTYTTEWTTSTISFYFDGKLCLSRSWTPTNVVAPAPFDRPFTLDLMFKSGDSNNAATPSTPSSASMYVDYVKAWS